MFFIVILILLSCVADFNSDRERALNITVYILNKYRRCENKIKRYIYTLLVVCKFTVVPCHRRAVNCTDSVVERLAIRCDFKEMSLFPHILL